MNLFGGAVGGVIAGIVGAAVWAGIAYGTGYEIGWIAWGIGMFVGLGVAKGAEGESAPAGWLAVLITLLAIVGGKYATVELLIGKELGDGSHIVDEIIAGLNDESFTSSIADTLVAEKSIRGEDVNWPEGVDPSSASTEAEYPQEIWQQAAAQWADMSEDQRREFRQGAEASIRENVGASLEVLRAEIAREGFLQSFSGMDLLFFGLAVFTAYRVAASEGDETASADDEASAEESDEAEEDETAP